VTLCRGGFNLTERQFRMLVRRAIQRLLDWLKAQVDDEVLWRGSGIAIGQGQLKFHYLKYVESLLEFTCAL
jgi:hypothetical protein